MIPPGSIAHVRTVRAECRVVADDEIEVTGHLLDERPHATRRIVHDMTLTIRVRYPDLVITAAEGRMDHRPYTLCTDAVPPLQQLVGLSVMQGFVRAVNERFGRQLGCAHMTALIHAIAPVVRQGAGAAFEEDEDVPPPDQNLWFVNTCQAWKADGPLHQRVRAGDVEGVRAFFARDREPGGA